MTIRTTVFRSALAAVCVVATAGAQAPKPQDIPYLTTAMTLERGMGFTTPRLSPDGKWFAFVSGVEGVEGSNIWVMRAAGGSPVQVTTGPHQDASPTWFRTGDRIAFYSDRTNALMTVTIDPQTGRPAGALKRVTIDTVRPQSFDVSPDGKSIAYASVRDKQAILQIIPSGGGPARVIRNPGPVGNAFNNVRYGADGSSIYFLSSQSGAPAPDRSVQRVSLADGSISTSFKIPVGMMGVQIDPIANRVLIRNGDTGYLTTLGGDSLVSFAWAEGMRANQFAFSLDASALFMGLPTTRTSARVLPLDGGPERTIGIPGHNEWPFEWLGNRPYYWDMPDRGVFSYLGADGKSRGSVVVDPAEIKPDPKLKVTIHGASPDGRYFVLVVVTAPGSGRPLYIYDSRTKTTRQITSALAGNISIEPGRGYGTTGTEVVGDEVIYAIHKGNNIEIHAEKFTGGGRLLFTSPEEKYLRPGIKREQFVVTVGPNRMAQAPSFLRGSPLEIDVTVGNAAPRRVLTMPGADETFMSFSPDGKTLFVALNVLGENKEPDKQRGLFLAIGDDGSVQSQHSVDIPESVDQIRWSPDGQSVIALTENDPGTRTSIWRIPASGSQTPQRLSQREPGTFWNFALSPDGREVMLPVEENKGTAVWRIDLKQAAQMGKKGSK